MTTPNPQRARADYEQMASGFDAVLSHVAPVADAILERLPDPIHGTVVDIGCGTGEPGLTLAHRRPDLRVLGVDPAAAMIDIARRKASAVPNIEFVRGSAEEVDVPDAGVAAVASRFGLLSFGDPHRSVAELVRILAPGGVLQPGHLARHHAQHRSVHGVPGVARSPPRRPAPALRRPRRRRRAATTARADRARRVNRRATSTSSTPRS